MIFVLNGFVNVPRTYVVTKKSEGKSASMLIHLGWLPVLKGVEAVFNFVVEI